MEVVGIVRNLFVKNAEQYFKDRIREIKIFFIINNILILVLICLSIVWIQKKRK